MKHDNISNVIMIVIYYSQDLQQEEHYINIDIISCMQSLAIGIRKVAHKREVG